jgi:hypothetical protein
VAGEADDGLSSVTCEADDGLSSVTGEADDGLSSVTGEDTSDSVTGEEDRELAKKTTMAFGEQTVR